MSGLLSQIRLLAAALALLIACAVPAVAFGDPTTGGAGPDEAQFQPHGVATLLPSGLAIAPTDAPPEVVAAIEAGNQIATLPYQYGGGHNADFKGKGYDCSGSISYALHGGGLLDAPLDSGSFMKWAEAGEGSWITIYTNPGHAYMVVAGLRFDTSMRTPLGADAARRAQPSRTTTRKAVRRTTLSSRWSTTMRPTTGYTVRHPLGF
jgi:hypothetical protein